MSDDTPSLPWMNLILDRFKAIETRLDKHNDAVNGRFTEQDTVLAEIRAEVKTTNGRVTVIETERASEEKYRREERTALEDRRSQWRDRVNLFAIFGSAFLAGTAGYIGHAVGLW